MPIPDPSSFADNHRVLIHPFHLSDAAMNEMRLMIVEDNPDMRRVISRMIEGIAEQIIWCESGEDALEVFERSNQKPDLVLMDIEMGGIDGIAATASITKDFPATRVIIVTSHNDANLRDAARESGAVGFVLKENLIDLRQIISEIGQKAAHS